MDKTIIGRIEEKAIPETIHNYQSNILEQEITYRKQFKQDNSCGAYSYRFGQCVTVI